mgnify:CR=1 FL=1
MWTYILKQEYIDEDKSRIRGHIGNYWTYNGYDNSREPKLSTLGIPSFRKNLLSKYQKFPASTGELLKAEDLYINTKYNTDICSRYLPVINVDCVVHHSWLSILPLKRELSIYDSLLILSKIADDSKIENNNKERILKIYKHIVEVFDIQNRENVEIISNWASTHKLLAKDNNFYYPHELSIVLVDGFSNNKFAYIGDEKPTQELLHLMSLMGVKVIEEVEPHFEGDMTEEVVIKNDLIRIAPLISCIKDGEYDTLFSDTLSIIESLHFYKVEKIELTYKGANEPIPKNVFSAENSIYFVGEWRNNRVKNGIVVLLAKLLHLKKHELLLSTLLNLSFEEGIATLNDFGFNVDDELQQRILTYSNEIERTLDNEATIGTNNNNGISIEKQIESSNEAKRLVKKVLKDKGFEVEHADWSQAQINGVTRNGVEYPLVVISSKINENGKYHIRINPNEWKQLAKPNSMLWLRLDNNILVPIKAWELITYYDNVTLSFDTINLMQDVRIDKIMTVMQYFSQVKLDVAALNPDKHRSERLNEYLFNDNNPENSDLSNDTQL